MKRFILKTQVLALFFGSLTTSIFAQPFVDSGISLTGVYNGSLTWGDYDNDGDLDIFICGDSSSVKTSHIIRNDGLGVFTPQYKVKLAGVIYGSIALGDYDQDGDLDLLLTGYDAAYKKISKIYRNDTGTFIDVSAGLTGVGFNSSVAWEDYDNDGDLDILLSGSSSSGYISKIYTNNGNSTFSEELNISLPGVQYGSVAWGDYNNDNHPDFILTGVINEGTIISKIYNNNGNNTFSERTDIILPGVMRGRAEWGDYDNDGDLDLLLTGWLGSGLGQISRIYRNENNSFTDINAGLTGLSYSAAAWGDYDNDGDLDVLLAGSPGSGSISLIYRNDNGIFNDISAGLATGVSSGCAAWGDYDLDGDLDLLLSGYTGSVRFTKIYRNDATVKNTKPALPAGLLSVINNSTVFLKWNKTTDTQTPQDGLSYNLYIYESGQTTYKHPPHAFRQSHALNGRRLIAEIGNILWSSGGYPVNNLPPLKTYYWSVQAIDGGLAGSSFATEKSFVMPLYTPTVQSSSLIFSAIQANQAAVTWSTGGGTNRAVFIKAGGTGPADPADNTTYAINSLTPGGWKCVYNGTSNNAIITGLTPDIDYSVHVCEYNGIPGSEKYLKSLAFKNPSVINTVFSEQTGIPLPGSQTSSVVWGDYDNDNDLDIFFSALAYIYNGTSFTEINQLNLNINPPIIGAAAWGDYDNDGDLDLLMDGAYYKGGGAGIFTNNGDKTFSNQNISVPALSEPSVAWGDYDNDGNQDILFTGSGTLKYAGIYRNNGNKTFTQQTGISLHGVDRSSVAWGDYDNDNDIDILLTGCDDNSNKVSKIYRNESNNYFAEQTQITLRGVEYGSVAWGDYDNDGDLDILLTGQEADGNRISLIYRNDGNSSFMEQSGITLPGVYYGSGSWGDYDNDGDLDILLTGTCSDGTIISRIFRNNGNNSFAEQTGVYLTGVYMSSVTWADCDNDSDLDILITGQDASSAKIAKLYRNNSLKINNIPSAPSNLSYIVLSNAKLLFRWNNVRTDETSSKSLSYNVRIGRKSGGVNFVSPQSASGGFRKIPEMGNAQLDTTFVFSYRWDTLYYASVQAIDNSFKGGPFSNEIQVKITPVQPSNLVGINKTNTSILLKWKRGNGNRCILFAKEGTTGSAYPQNLTTYFANPVFTEGSPVGTTGWYCIYKGEADSVAISGLIPSKNYRIHAIEFQGPPGSEIYASAVSGGNIGTFSTSLFTEQQGLGLSNVGASSLAWGDYDNDGDLDILLTGAVINQTYGPSPVSGLFTNNGNNTFSEQTSLTLPDVYSGSTSWIDYDNDEDLDILITGYGGVTKIFRNDGYTAFTEQTQIIMPQVSYSSAVWGDYNNDGNVDLLLTGESSYSEGGEPVSHIYRNYGNGIFGQQFWIPLTPVYFSAAAWGDYDNDGNLDILLTGATGDSKDYKPVSRVYHNTGDSTFTEVKGISLTGVYEGSVNWVDYDNDNDLDIFLTGATSSVYSNKEPVSKIYRNNGDGTFTERTDIVIKGVYNSSSAWGDFDNDGDLDLLISGSTLPSSRFSAIYKNEGDNGFVEQKDISLLNLGGSSVSWADYDNDGDLDFFLSGFDANDNAFTAIYRNNSVMMASSIPPNRKPAAPISLKGEITPNNIRLTWSPVTGDETPFRTMSYNVRWRLNTDTLWHFAPHSATNGYRRVVALGNVQLNKFYDLKEWPVGTWEWQVQAVDQGYQGGTWSEIDTFTVRNTQAFFKTDTVCQGLSTHFTDQSIASDGIASWKWYFSDGTTSLLQNPLHNYSAGGTYNVKLVITSTKGDKDSLSQNVIVKLRPLTSFSAPNVCEGLTAQITNSTISNGTIISGWYWNFGDGVISTEQNPVTHYYSDKGTYNIKLKAIASNGCIDSLVKPLVIATYPNSAISVNGKTTLCEGDSVSLSVEYNSLYNYQWRLDNNDLSNGLSSTYMVKTYSGSYSVRITNPLANCISTSAQTAVTINPIPVSPYISASGPIQFCQGDSVILSVTNTPDYVYLWKLNGGAVGDNSNKFAARTGGTYTLEISNSNGCSVYSTDSVNVTVNTIPTVGDLSQLGKPSFCEGDSVILSTPLVTGYLYSWRNEYGPIANAVTTNSYTAKSSGIYQLDVSSASGCSVRTSPVYVTVRESPVKPVLDSVNYQPGKCPGEDPITLKINQTVAEYKYQWFKDGVALFKDTLSYLELYEKGNYKLEAELNQCVSESRIVNINIPDGLPKPQIYVQGPAVWYLACSNKTAAHYRWYCNNVLIKDAPDKYIYVAGHKMGEYRVSIVNSLGCYTSSNVISIPSGITGIDDIDPFEGLKLYPNPTTGLFSVEIENEVFGDLLIRIYNQDGKELYNFIFEKTSAYFSAELNLSGKPGGYYLITFDLDRRFAAKKIIIE